MEYYTGKGRNGQDKQKKTCRKTQHVKIDMKRDVPKIICRIVAVGENYNSTRDSQRQRVAIARMLLQKAPVMVFDDSLSAVDAETDYRIRRALKTRMKDTTVILISHRINTLMGASQILVLNQGRIAETGTHQELLEKNGIYRKIYDIQMSHDDRKGGKEHGSL